MLQSKGMVVGRVKKNNMEGTMVEYDSVAGAIVGVYSNFPWFVVIDKGF